METLGFGLVGCGYFGQHLARTVGAIEGAEVVAMADRNVAAVEERGWS